MDGRVRLDQAFYGYGRSGYGLAGYSFDDEGAAWAAINVCLAIGQATGSRLPKPILLSRILGDKIVMARICNGAKDPSGRNTLFVHALVGLSQEVSKAHVTAFTLEEAGIFRDSMPGHVVEAIMVAANLASATTAHASVELPAAIETSAPDEKLIRRIVSGRENELSWSTFAFEDMSGYDVICISTLASIPPYRAVYGQDMRLLRKRQSGSIGCTKPARADASVIPVRSSLPPRDVRSSAVAGRKNSTVAILIASIVLNLVLSAIICMMIAGKAKGGHGGDLTPDARIEQAARARFTDDQRVTDKMLKSCRFPLGDLAKETDEVKKEYSDQIDLLRKLLAYRDFVEIQIIKNRKEQ